MVGVALDLVMAVLREMGVAILVTVVEEEGVIPVLDNEVCAYG